MAAFPKAVVQLCVLHMVRHSLNYISCKRRKEVVADLRRIYTAATAEEAELMLGEFEYRRDAERLPIGQSWRSNWRRLTRSLTTRRKSARSPTHAKRHPRRKINRAIGAAERYSNSGAASGTWATTTQPAAPLAYASMGGQTDQMPAIDIRFCVIEDPSCEACQ